MAALQTANDQPMLETTDLAYRYPGGESLTFPNLHCAAGVTHLLLGKSGSGKTTLLQLLAGLRSPSHGKVVVNGSELGQLSTAALDKFRGQNIGMVFQTAHFVRSVNVEENLVLAQRLAGKATDRRRIRELLDVLGLGEKLRSLPARLSVGQQQRAAIARAVINQPALILADEPTSALDDDNASQVLGLLQQQAAAVNATLIIVTHDNRLTGIIDQRTHL